MLRLFPGGAFLAAALALCVAGCDAPEAISTYDTPRTAPRGEPLSAPAIAASLDHMFAAVVPDGGKAWFFKVVAPAADAKSVGKSFDQFLSTIELQPDGKTPGWKLPEGWQEKPGTDMRVATIEIPHQRAPLELAVTTLPLEEPWDSYLVRNVARWMGQLQEAPLSADVVAKIARKVTGKKGEATVFELVGVMDRKSAMPAGHPPIGPMNPPAARAAGSATSPPSAGDEPKDFTYALPPGWQLGSAGAMRKATFLVSGGGGKAELSVTAFGAQGMMADPMANARRWAGELGMDVGDNAKLETAMTDMKIDGGEGHYMEFVPPAAGGNSQATLAAMVQRDGQMWFFKLKGDRSAIENQRQAFRKFLESIKFAGK
jgi:hypothetical protein